MYGPSTSRSSRADRGDVDRVRDELALERRGDLLGDDHAGPVLRLLGRRGEVRRDDDVVELEQRPEYGSAEKTSSAAPATLPERSASSSASSSTSSPRAALTSRTPSRICANAVASIEPLRLVGEREVERDEVRRGEDVVGRLGALDAELAEALLARRTGRTRRRASRARRRDARPAGRSGRSRARRGSCPASSMPAAARALPAPLP